VERSHVGDEKSISDFFLSLAVIFEQSNKPEGSSILLFFYHRLNCLLNTRSSLPKFFRTSFLI